MSFAIAVAGKGGTGKTSLTSLVIRYLKKNNLTPILAIDADANANLGESLGFKPTQTIGSIIASFNGDKISIPSGLTKEAFLEIKLNGALLESQGIDLLTMGRGEGAECYCYPNSLLRKFADELAGNYAYVVLDNEAGMEHLSRRTTQNIDLLLIVSNHTVKGVRTVGRIKELVDELKLVVKKQAVLINQVPTQLSPLVSEELSRLGIKPEALIPEDDMIQQYDLEMKPLLDLPDNSKAVSAMNSLLARLLPKPQPVKN